MCAGPKVGSFLWGARHRANHTLVGIVGISPERNGPSPGIGSGKSCILGQEMKTQEVGLSVEQGEKHPPACQPGGHGKEMAAEGKHVSG